MNLSNFGARSQTSGRKGRVELPLGRNYRRTRLSPLARRRDDGADLVRVRVRIRRRFPVLVRHRRYVPRRVIGVRQRLAVVVRQRCQVVARKAMEYSLPRRFQDIALQEETVSGATTQSGYLFRFQVIEISCTQE